MTEAEHIIERIDSINSCLDQVLKVLLKHGHTILAPKESYGFNEAVRMIAIKGYTRRDLENALNRAKIKVLPSEGKKLRLCAKDVNEYFKLNKNLN